MLISKITHQTVFLKNITKVIAYICKLRTAADYIHICRERAFSGLC
uniref:Uncharacterized protein n=1 Tax=Anguilla anguilla TaxID=7936 RepID=A0A0E9U5U9_ANGAN